MAKLAILFGVFLVISIAHGYLFPKNYEITYKYEALMKLSIEKPTLYSSELLTDAKLTLKTYENQIVAVLHDIEYSMYNGKGSHVGIDTKILQVPPEAKSLSLPFIIEYEKNGKVIGIKTEDNDQPWSINIKKAIASALQLDIEQVLQGQSIYAFNSEEPTVHGNCKVLYSVIRKDSNFVIKKHNNPTSCKGFKWETNFNLHSTPCDEDFENPLTLSTDRRYEVVKKDDSFFLDRVQTLNTIIMAPFRSNSDMYTLLANQTLSVVKVEELKDSTTKAVAKDSHDLKIKFYPQDADKEYDFTGGRAKYDGTVLIENIKTGLKIFVDQLDHIQSHFSTSDELVETTSNILYKLKMLSEKQIDTLYELLKSDNLKTKPLFIEMLPHVGTRASHVLLIKIISEKDFFSETAIKLLQQVPFFIRNPDSRLVKELMTLCDKEKVSESVKNAVKIAASNIISFVLEKHPDDKVAHAYVDSFIEKFTKSVEYADQLMYLSALANVKARKSVKFLEHVIKNDVQDIKVSDHIRALAIWAIRNEYLKNSEHFDKTYWPLLEDKKEDTEVRVAALTTLMDNPSVESLLKMHVFMETERDKELYNVYYTLLKSISESKQPCNKKIALNARKILSITRKAESSASFTYLTDYIDSVYGFGESLKVSLVQDTKDKYVSLYIQYSPQASNINVNYKALYVHFSTEEDKTFTNKLTLSNKSVKDYENLAEWITSDEVQNNTKIEFVWLHNGQVTSFNIMNDIEWENILQFFDSRLLVKDKFVPNYDLEQFVAGTSIIATDLGIPVDAYFKTPSTKRFKYYLSPMFLGFVNFDMKFVMYNNQIYGLGFYNPLVDVRQGVHRSHVQKIYFPFEIDFSAGFGTLELTFNHSSNDIIESFGLQTSASSQVYITDVVNNENKLKSTCAQCKDFTVVTKGEEHQKQVTIWKNDLKYLGFLLKLEFFDCELDVSDYKLSQLSDRLFSEENKNVGDLEPLQFLLTLKHVLTYTTLSPFPGRCGVRASITPGQTHTKFSIGELVDKVPIGNNETRNDEYYGFKYEMFHKDKPTEYWGCRVPQNITKFTARAECTYKDDKTIYKICFNRKMKYGQDHCHESYNTISMGIVDDEAKCPEDTTITIHMSRHEVEKSPDVFKSIVKTCQSYHSALTCATEYVIPQNISLDIKYHNISPIGYEMWNDMIEYMKKDYSTFFVETDKEYTEKGNIKINFLSNWKNFNMEIVTPKEKLQFENITNEYEEFFDDADMKDFVYYFDDIDFCTVETDYITNADGIKKLHTTSTDWSEIGAYECNCPDKWTLYVKKEYVEDKAENENKDSSEEANSDVVRLAFRIHSSGDNLDIHFEDRLKVYLNDKLLQHSEDTEYFDGVWFEAKSYDAIGIFVLNFKNLNNILVLEHERKSAKVILPNKYLTKKCHATRSL